MLLYGFARISVNVIRPQKSQVSGVFFVKFSAIHKGAGRFCRISTLTVKCCRRGMVIYVGVVNEAYRICPFPRIMYL